MKVIALAAAAVLVPMAWGAICAVLFSRKDKKRGDDAQIDYMI